MEFDDGIRGNVGVAVCLRSMGDGTSRLFFDDVTTQKNNSHWTAKVVAHGCQDSWLSKKARPSRRTILGC
jgi:hypothetical protein